MKSRCQYPALALVVAMAGLLQSCSGKPAAAPAAAVPPALATLRVAGDGAGAGRSWDGVVQAVSQAALSAQTSGRVSRVEVDVNDQVAKGAVLLRLTAVEQGASLNSARAGLRAAQAQAAEADGRYRRAQQLIEAKLISQDEFDRVSAARASAAAASDAAAAQLAEAQQQLAYTVVRAPFAGVISARHVEPGETVGLGQPLLALYAPGELRLEVQLPQADAAAVRKDPRASVELADGQLLQAARVIVFPSADPLAHSVVVRILLPRVAQLPLPGQTAKVVFAASSRGGALMVPEQAVVQRGELTAVYVVDGGTVVLRQLRLGRRKGEQVEVLAGLSAGEQVALDPVAALRFLVTQRKTETSHRE